MSDEPSLSERLAQEFASGEADLTRASRLSAIPAPSGDVPALLKSVRAIKQILDTLTGASGSVLDKVLTTRDMLREGALTYSPSTGLTTAAPIYAPVVGGGSGGGGGYTDPRPVYATPPTPSGLTASSGLDTVILNWDLISYRNHAYVEVWRSLDVDNLGSATLLDTTYGAPFSDQTVTADHSYYYWVRAVNFEAVAGAYNAVGGAFARPAQNPDTILTLLTGQITTTQLFESLARPVSNIEAWDDENATGIIENSVGIYEENLRRAALDGSVQSLYTVRAEVTAGGRTVVGGFGLAGTSSAAEGPRIDFGVRADTFWVGAPSSSVGVPDKLMFVIRTTTTTEGGVTIDPGVYIDSANIVNLTALYARINTLVADQIEATNISVTNLTGGMLTVGSYIQSQGYSAGVSGFRIEAGGLIDAANITARGTIYALAGSIGGITIGASSVFTTSYVPGTTGWSIKADGSVEFTSGLFRGNVQASSGSIGGVVIGADNIRSSNFDGTTDGSGALTSLGTQGWAATSGGTFVLDAAIVRHQKTASATEQKVVYSGVGIGASAAEVTLMEDFVSGGYVVSIGLTGYVAIYTTAEGGFAEVWARVKATRTDAVSPVVYAPWVKQSVKFTEGRPWPTPAGFQYLVPLSMTWAYTGGYYVSRSYPPGSAGAPLPPVFVDGALVAGTWDMALELQTQAVDPVTNLEIPVLQEIRLHSGFWMFEHKGSQPVNGVASGIA